MNALPRLIFGTLIGCGTLYSQAPDVPIYPEGRNPKSQAVITDEANRLKEKGELVPMEKVVEQMSRTTCELELPKPRTGKLEGRELWNTARRAHLRVGWHYLCKKCSKWHLNLAGGYAITNDAVVTCGHVLENEDIREGYLIVADEDDKVIPVVEVLAANRATDTAIIRVKGATLNPLPFTSDVMPGDKVYCFSEPKGRRGYFSEGIVNRFTKHPFRSNMREAAPGTGTAKPEAGKPASKPAPPAPSTKGEDEPVWIQVSTSWAPGSSGSAVLDAHGNAIGHVSQIQTVYQDPSKTTASAPGTLMVLHDAIAASNVLKLIKTKSRSE
ncbi:trypsin-like peptidase [Roseimicrobium gellanilyticum]|uniref:Trypsin-like peptidase n=1 Tax=Roseimicrobium gellanilyticum TaxID=748857 RepID=A0A366HUN9_9BACT|nr:serine protease [Roseimicrobium gellanilyticum]RBP47992.1 trypsin-like peptidase [Roseimicrobium gellanilyticum]